MLLIRAHDRHDGDSIAFGPGESRSPNASSATPPPADHEVCTTVVRPSVVKQRLSSRAHGRLAVDANRPACVVCRRGDRFAPSLGSKATRLRDAPLLRDACNGGVPVFTPADLSSLTFDPQTTRRDASRGREPRGRLRARAAQAGRAEISEWEIDSRFHRRSSWYRQTPPPPNGSPGNAKSRLDDRSTVRCSVEVAGSATRWRSAVSIGTRLPGRAL